MAELEHAVRKVGLEVVQQFPVSVSYEGELVGEYFPDLIVNKCVIVELKSAEAIAQAHEAQLVNYLRATGFEVGPVLNFGPSAEFKRRILDQKPTQLLSVIFDPS